MTRLALSHLGAVRAGVRIPAYDPAALKRGLVHLGLGAFARAHQAAFTEDALEAAGGAWGVCGVSLRRPDAATALRPQDGLYTLEIRSPSPSYRVIGVVRETLTAPVQHEAVLAALSDPCVHVVTLTVTEPGYALTAEGMLDVEHADVAADLAGAGPPRSVAGWLVAGLGRRIRSGAGPVTILSCDNLRNNGRKLAASVGAMAERLDPELARRLDAVARFPNSMVDAITPASDEALRRRVAAAVGLTDAAAVQREPFAQWAIEDDFVGPRPAWDRVGVEIVADVAELEALKLHVLNAVHSALAYLGPQRGHQFVREAVTDPELAGFLDALVTEEIAPALAPVAVAPYWRATRARLGQPAIDHRLDQIARDGDAKLKERIHPLIVANARAGRPVQRLRSVVEAWLATQGRPLEAALADPFQFGAPFREDAAVRAAMTANRP